jgi:uncharacterized protein YccT (UPF0319 family)
MTAKAKRDHAQKCVNRILAMPRSAMRKRRLKYWANRAAKHARTHFFSLLLAK